MTARTSGNILVLLAALLLQNCAIGRQLATTTADPAELKGTYTLLLYGCRHSEDIKNLAILVDEEKKFPVEIYDLPTSYYVKKGIPGPQALKEADAFLGCTVRRMSGTRLQRISDEAGTIGYELRPLYSWLEFGIEDVLRTTYFRQTNGSVRVSVGLDPEVEEMLESSGSDHHHSSDY